MNDLYTLIFIVINISSICIRVFLRLFTLKLCIETDSSKAKVGAAKRRWGRGKRVAGARRWRGKGEGRWG